MATKLTSFEKITAVPEIGEHEKIEVKLNKNGDHFVISFRNSYTRKHWETGEEEKFPCGPSRGATEFIQRFLEKQDLRANYPSRKISVPCTDISCLILKSWPLGQTYFEAAAVLKVYTLVGRVNKQRKAAELVAKYKETGKYDNGVFKTKEKFPLSTYQKVALHAATLAGSYGLFMEQGTGKTAVAVTRISHEAEIAASKGKFYRAIVVCPKNVRYNWTCEVEKFASCQGSTHIIAGQKLDRGKQLVEALVNRKPGDKFSVIVMNYETVDSCKEAFELVKALLSQTEGFDFENGKLFDLGLLDEAHYIKTPTAKRSKACVEDLRKQCVNRMILTGTPITNHPFDLYMQSEFLDEGMSGFASYSAFKNFFGVFEGGAMGYDKLVDLQNIPILKERLTRTSFSISKKEALPDLPDKVYDTYEVEMTAKQTELYKKMAAQIVAEVEMEQASGKIKKELAVNHILTKLLRLAQITSGFVGIPEVIDELTEEVIEEKTQYVLDENPKVEALVEILKEKDPTDKTIVWACFVQDIQTISARLTAEGIKHVTYYGGTSVSAREAAVKSFNEDRECKVFLANPAAASTGLNLLGYPPGAGEDYDTNCNHVIYFSQNWSSDKRIQSEDRCHRRGTRQNIRVTDLVVPCSIDTEIRQRVEAKREMASDVANVDEILSNIMSSLSNLY